jgi:hypothetical protein
MLAYTALMWVLTSVWFFAVAREEAFIFVDTRLSPHLRLSGCSPGQLTPQVAAMLQILASDGALVRVSRPLRWTARLIRFVALQGVHTLGRQPSRDGTTVPDLLGADRSVCAVLPCIRANADCIWRLWGISGPPLLLQGTRSTAGLE